MKTALVLSGGGAKGAYEIGAWKAFNEFNIEFDVLSGTSIGALNGLLMATKTYEYAKEMWFSIEENLAESMYTDMAKLSEADLDTINRVFKEPQLVNELVHIKGALNNSYLSKQIKIILEDSKIKKDFYVCSVIVDEEPEPCYFNLKDKDHEFVTKAVISSASIPVISDAVEINGAYYFDGGILQNTPITPVLEHDCDLIIASLLKTKDLDHLKVFTHKPILPLLPSEHLGDFKTGTMNFSRKAVELKMELGYNDTYNMLRTLKALF